jgi:hypothetical protein
MGRNQLPGLESLDSLPGDARFVALRLYEVTQGRPGNCPCQQRDWHFHGLVSSTDLLRRRQQLLRLAGYRIYLVLQCIEHPAYQGALCESGPSWAMNDPTKDLVVVGSRKLVDASAKFI